MLKLFVPVIAVLFLNSCAAYKLVKGGSEIEVGKGLAVTPSLDWNKISDGDVDVWTLDGPILQQIIFVKGAEEGDYLIPVRKAGSLAIDENVPRIEKSITSIEVLEIFEATLTQMKAQKIKITKIRPYKTKFTDGFRFEFTFLTSEGLEKLGSTYSVISGDKLYMGIYLGAKIHYYNRGIQDFENIIRTMKIS